MRELSDDLIRRVAADYGMEIGATGLSGTIGQLRLIMEWARDEARAVTIREFLYREQCRVYPSGYKETTQGEH